MSIVLLVKKGYVECIVHEEMAYANVLVMKKEHVKCTDDEKGACQICTRWK